MISKSEKKRIKKYLGNHYVASIQKELQAKEIYAKNGEEYSASYITNVMNGQPNEVLEDVIFSLVQKEIVKQEELKEKRKAILNG